MTDYKKMEADLGLDPSSTYPEKFGSALVMIANLQRQIEFMRKNLVDIRDNKKWSGERCRSIASYTLERYESA